MTAEKHQDHLGPVVELVSRIILADLHGLRPVQEHSTAKYICCSTQFVILVDSC